MSRPHVSVRCVTPDLQAQLAELWVCARVEAGATAEAAGRAVTEGRLAAALTREDVRVYLAYMDDEPIGYLALSHSFLSGLAEPPCVVIDQLYVAKASRRHGAARALLLAATTYAERCGSDQLAASVPAPDREANRFFARLGFSAHVVKRLATTAALRRRLTGEEPRQGLEQILQRRRSLRARSLRSERQLIGN